MDLTKQELETIADELGVSLADLQSEAVKDCAESVKRENPGMDKSTAFAICQDMENQGLLAAPVHVTLAELQEPGAIERVEQDGAVRYRNIKLLAPGVWGDAGSGREILYSQEGIANSADNWADNTVNLFHERENEVTDVGTVDTDSVFLGEDDGGLFADIVLHLENPASEFADEALQNALETGGREGLQGPSVELRGDDYRFNDERNVQELVEGTFNGLGLVGLGVSPGPGSEDAAFAEQTRDRAVALAGTDDAAVLTPQDTHERMKPDALRDRLAEADIQLGDLDPEDADAEDLQRLAAAFDIELEQHDDDMAEDDDDEDGEDDEAADDGDDEEDDDDGMDMADLADRVDELGTQVEENADRIESIAAATEELQDADIDLSGLQESVAGLDERLEALADADEVAELADRIAALEDEPEQPTSMMDGGDGELTDADDEQILVELGADYDPTATF